MYFIFKMCPDAYVKSLTSVLILPGFDNRIINDTNRLFSADN